MRHGSLRKLLTCAVVGLLPGCIPAVLRQETAPSQPTFLVRDVQPVREGMNTPPPIPQATLLVSLPQEQELTPQRTVTQRLAAPEPLSSLDVPPLKPTVPVDQLPVPEAPSDSALVAAVRAYLEGDLERTRKLLGESRSAPTLATQEELLGLLTHLQDQDLDDLPGEVANQFIDKVERLVHSLQARAPLHLEQLCFCRRIKAFGVFDPLTAEPRFQTGSNGQPGERVCVYAEVRNVSTCKEGQLHVVALDGTLEILNRSDEVVFRTDFPATPDRSRSRRTDCYVGYEFNIPANLPPGEYRLRVQVRDLAQETPRCASQTLGFRVREGTTTAATR